MMKKIFFALALGVMIGFMLVTISVNGLECMLPPGFCGTQMCCGTVCIDQGRQCCPGLDGTGTSCGSDMAGCCRDGSCLEPGSFCCEEQDPHLEGACRIIDGIRQICKMPDRRICGVDKDGSVQTVCCQEGGEPCGNICCVPGKTCINPNLNELGCINDSTQKACLRKSDLLWGGYETVPCPIDVKCGRTEVEDPHSWQFSDTLCGPNNNTDMFPAPDHKYDLFCTTGYKGDPDAPGINGRCCLPNKDNCGTDCCNSSSTCAYAGTDNPSILPLCCPAGVKACLYHPGSLNPVPSEPSEPTATSGGKKVSGGITGAAVGSGVGEGGIEPSKILCCNDPLCVNNSRFCSVYSPADCSNCPTGVDCAPHADNIGYAGCCPEDKPNYCAGTKGTTCCAKGSGCIDGICTRPTCDELCKRDGYKGGYCWSENNYSLPDDPGCDKEDFSCNEKHKCVVKVQEETCLPQIPGLDIKGCSAKGIAFFDFSGAYCDYEERDSCCCVPEAGPKYDYCFETSLTGKCGDCGTEGWYDSSGELISGDICTIETSCNDGIDNDKDGAIDDEDTDCSEPMSAGWTSVMAQQAAKDAGPRDGEPRVFGCEGFCEQAPVIDTHVEDNDLPSQMQCLNHLDDDNDGLVDYPNDPGCDSPEDGDESNSEIFTLPFSGWPRPTFPPCHNHIDDDNDGFIDYPADPDCHSPQDSEASTPAGYEKITVCRGDGPGCDIVCTDDDCRDELQSSIESNREITWMPGDYPVRSMTAIPNAFIFIYNKQNVIINGYGARLFIDFSEGTHCTSQAPGGGDCWQGGIYAYDGTDIGAGTKDITINGVEVVGDMQCNTGYCFGIFSGGLIVSHINDAKVSGVYGMQYFMGGAGHPPPGTIGDLSIINSYGKGDGVADVLGGGADTYLLVKGNTFVQDTTFCLDSPSCPPDPTIPPDPNGLALTCLKNTEITQNFLRGDLVLSFEDCSDPVTRDILISDNVVSPPINLPYVAYGVSSIAVSRADTYNVMIKDNSIWNFPDGTRKGIIYIEDIGTADSRGIVWRDNGNRFPQPSAMPTGNFEGVSSGGIASGWAYDPDDSPYSIEVDFYIDGISPENFVGLVKTSEGVGEEHRFDFIIPPEFKDGAQHQIYAYGIDMYGLDSPRLAGSPLSFTLNN
jgi:hypothetical protein